MVVQVASSHKRLSAVGKSAGERSLGPVDFLVGDELMDSVKAFAAF